MEKKSDFGLIGLAVMGQNLVLNVESRGFQVSVYNRTTSKMTDFIAENPGRNLIGEETLEGFVQSLAVPRKIQIMVQAGGPVDAVIKALMPLLDPNDIIIDGGNSLYTDTERRDKYVSEAGFRFIGAGVSGGEEGALKGPSIMPGGPESTWEVMKPIFESISAKVDGEPCVVHIGEGGAGHFVKMVHNGIEYAEMQLLAVTYAVLAHQMSYTEISLLFEEWNCGSEASYLLEITSKILQQKEGNDYVLDLILDNAGSKGTGMWSTKAALDLGEANTMMSSAVFARYLSSMKQQRTFLAHRKPNPKQLNSFDLLKLKEAYIFARTTNHIQGFNLIEASSKKYNWNYNPAEIARVWTQGCIIRSRLMEDLIGCFSIEKSLLNNEKILDTISKTEPNIAVLLHHAIDQKIALDSYSSAYHYWMALCTRNLPANLIQAQRDFFGAHTYQRVDKPLGKFFHTKWY